MLCVDASVKSYSYDTMLTLAGVGGGSVVYVDVKECVGQSGALGSSVEKISCVR